MLLDGALATTLQSVGLPQRTPVDAWIRTHPERIATVHADFAAKGAELLLAGTFRLLPHLRADWRGLSRRAVDLAAASSVPVWASVGPPGEPGRPWDGDVGGYQLLAASLEGRVAGVVLETFVHLDELERVLSAMLPALVVPVVACLSPAPSGMLWSGEDVVGALDRLREAGASMAGFNCGPGCCAAARRCLDAGEGVDWLKPNQDDESIDDALLVAIPHVGGCCGTSPAHIEALGARRAALGLVGC